MFCFLQSLSLSLSLPLFACFSVFVILWMQLRTYVRFIRISPTKVFMQRRTTRLRFTLFASNLLRVARSGDNESRCLFRRSSSNNIAARNMVQAVYIFQAGSEIRWMLAQNVFYICTGCFISRETHSKTTVATLFICGHRQL
jgi:hypothetical protein